MTAWRTLFARTGVPGRRSSRSQEVDREAGVVLDRGDDLGGGGLRVVAEREHPQDRPVEDGEVGERVDGSREPRLDRGVDRVPPGAAVLRGGEYRLHGPHCIGGPWRTLDEAAAPRTDV